jgi:hypothetical protein
VNLRPRSRQSRRLEGSGFQAQTPFFSQHYCSYKALDNTYSIDFTRQIHKVYLWGRRQCWSKGSYGLLCHASTHLAQKQALATPNRYFRAFITLARALHLYRPNVLSARKQPMPPTRTDAREVAMYCILSAA